VLVFWSPNTLETVDSSLQATKTTAANANEPEAGSSSGRVARLTITLSTDPALLNRLSEACPASQDGMDIQEKSMANREQELMNTAGGDMEVDVSVDMDVLMGRSRGPKKKKRGTK
jgi:hypothetical protein